MFAGNTLPDATREAGGVLGLDEFGTYQNLGARSGITAALKMAEFFDAENDFGWGFDLNDFGWRTDSNYDFVLANQELPEMAIAGVSLGRFGKYEPLLWTERDRLPTLTSQFLWKAKTEWYTNPVVVGNHLVFYCRGLASSTAI